MAELSLLKIGIMNITLRLVLGVFFMLSTMSIDYNEDESQLQNFSNYITSMSRNHSTNTEFNDSLRAVADPDAFDQITGSLQITKFISQTFSFLKNSIIPGSFIYQYFTAGETNPVELWAIVFFEFVWNIIIFYWAIDAILNKRFT